jgi:hypothetical protein
VSGHDVERLRDIIDAIGAIRQHLARGELSDALIYDAVRMRLVEIVANPLPRSYRIWPT